MKEGIRELNLEEMAKISGGGPLDTVKDDGDYNTTTQPHCLLCRNQVSLVNGSYICDNVHCMLIGKQKTATEVAWY